MKRTKKLALSALLAAMTVVLLLLGGLVELLDLSAAALASLLVMLVSFELGAGYATLLWAVAATLSLILYPSGASLFYAAIGLYPLLKRRLERFPRPIEWTLKMLCAALLLAAYVLIGKFVLMLADEVLTGWLLPVFLLLSLCAFVLYDVALSRLVVFYGLRLRPRLERLFK